MDRNYQNKVVLITGAARGIGKGIALKIASEGARVVVNDFGSEELANQVVHDIEQAGGKAIAIDADVSNRSAVTAMMDEVIAQFGRIDVVIPNATASTRAPIVDSEWESVERTIQIIQFGVFHVCQIAAQHMIRQEKLYDSRGKIAVIGSIMSEFSAATCAPYTMSKAAITQFAKTLAAELAPHRINVNIVKPGWIDTPGERAFSTEEEIAMASPALPWGRLGQVEEVANAVSFLCSDDANYISGSELRVDGAYMPSLKLPLPAGSL